MVPKKIFFISILAAWALAVSAPAKVVSLNGKAPYVPGEILVRFNDGTTDENRAKAMALFGPSRALNHPNLFKIKLKAGLSIEQAVDQIKGNPDVKYAQPNYRYYALTCGPPTDIYYASPENWPFTKIQAPQAWALFSSCSTPPGPGNSSVTVAVLDTGISRNHPDLRSVPLVGYNAIGEVGEEDASCTQCSSSPCNSCGYFTPYTDGGGPCTYSSDDFGHGTYVAGIIGAEWNGGTLNPEAGCNVAPTSGMAGLAPGITLLAVKVLDCTGGGSTDSIVSGTNFAVAHGAKILNFSLGSPSAGGLDPAEKEALDNAIANDCVIVAASGNESDSGKLAPVDFPAAYPPVVAVGATDENDQLAFYSNGGANLKLVAPGGYGESGLTGAYRPDLDIFGSFLCPLSNAATTEGGFVISPSDSNFGTAAGTSASTPFVSATAALLWSMYPNLTNNQVIDQIINNTDSLDGGTGWNAQTGYGRLNVYQALLNAGSGSGQVTQYLTTFNSPNPFYTTTDGTTNITIAITQPAPVELTIYDSSGEVVLHKKYDPGQLNNNPSNPQFKSFYVPWDGRNGSGQPVVTGIYFYSVKANGQTGRNKIALVQGSK